MQQFLEIATRLRASSDAPTDKRSKKRALLRNTLYRIIPSQLIIIVIIIIIIAIIIIIIYLVVVISNSDLQLLKQHFQEVEANEWGIADEEHLQMKDERFISDRYMIGRHQ